MFRKISGSPAWPEARRGLSSVALLAGECCASLPHRVGFTTRCGGIGSPLVYLKDRYERERADAQIVGADGTRDTKSTSMFRSKSCLPMAPGLPIGGAETSVRRRFWAAL